MMAALYSCCHCGTALLSRFMPPLSIGEVLEELYPRQGLM
jgi:hypothetical protein